MLMGNLVMQNLPRWDFYLSLERDLERCFRYVPPIEGHLHVVSDEFAKITLLASSEFENVLMDIKKTSGIKCKNNIFGYSECVGELFPKATEMFLSIPRYGIAFQPLADWSPKAPPIWWSQGYNKLKHDRLLHPYAASLSNSYFSLGSLQIILLHYYRMKFGQCSMPFKRSASLIVPHNWQSVWQETSLEWTWILPDDPDSHF